MNDAGWIMLAHALHVLAGAAWVGAVWVMALVVQPVGARHGAEGAARWTGMIALRTLNWIALVATVCVLSGLFLFAALHRHDRSAGGIALGLGALASLLALALGLGVGRPAMRQIARLAAAGSNADAAPRIAVLRRRAMLAIRSAAGLLVLATLAMGSFRGL